MSAPYDTYDYPSYWVGREYEHEAEVIALNSLLSRIHKIGTTLEIGTGFGRLVPSYLYRSKKIVLTDPSIKLLNVAKDTYRNKKISYIHSKLENLPKKIRGNSIDLVIMVRVLHHINDPDNAFQIISRRLKVGGYLILEFANKRHVKATISEFLKGNLTFPIDIFPKDVGKIKKKSPSLPFKNYHPDLVMKILSENGFKIIELRSVSNIRSTFLKRALPKELLLLLEKNLQIFLSKFYFGPSMFILAKRIR